ncbi:MAG: hypothetical protein FE78DRAFT_213301 [Acidomyces sp. 'richmondensis']|nr:MAG: hypothetical protein FE78DRAFT_213301 [Acidomyces sp. 'richmondensis']
MNSAKLNHLQLFGFETMSPAGLLINKPIYLTFVFRPQGFFFFPQEAFTINNHVSKSLLECSKITIHGCWATHWSYSRVVPETGCDCLKTQKLRVRIHQPLNCTLEKTARRRVYSSHWQQIILVWEGSETASHYGCCNAFILWPLKIQPTQY